MTLVVDWAARTISGIAVPYRREQVAHAGGCYYRFAYGSLMWAGSDRIRLVRDHDNAQILGRVIHLQHTRAGLLSTSRVRAGPAGDRALAEADQPGAGLSVSIDDDVVRRDPHDPRVRVIVVATLKHIALTAWPAFRPET